MEENVCTIKWNPWVCLLIWWQCNGKKLCVCFRLLNYKQCNALKCQSSSDILLSWLLISITKSGRDSIRSTPVIVNVLIDDGNINRHIYWVQLVSVAYSICSNRWYFHQNFNILSSNRRQMAKYTLEYIKIPIETGNHNKKIE